MYRSYNQSQSFLLPPSLYDFVDEGHPAHLINDLVDQLDLSVLEARYGNLGQPAYHPRLMLKVILYGFTVGVFSSRKLQRACQENLAFKYLAGLETPAFRTFIEFRQRHREDMQAVFVQTVKLARALGLARLGTVALDGTKVEANTSKHKAIRLRRTAACWRRRSGYRGKSSGCWRRRKPPTSRRTRNTVPRPMGTRWARSWRGGNSG
jgi:transposase